MTKQRRASGAGSIYRRKDGQWIGAITVTATPYKPQHRKCVSSNMFCRMLMQFSQLPTEEPSIPATGTGYERRCQRMKKARELGTHTEAEWLAKKCAQKGVCYYCEQHVGYEDIPITIYGRKVFLPKFLVQDHIVPIAKGGSDAIDNIVGACAECNSRKRTNSEEQFRAYLERLTR